MTEPPDDDDALWNSAPGMQSTENWLDSVPPTENASDVAPAHPFDEHEDTRYQQSAILGTGGMGRVWSVRDKRLHRSIALKELSPNAAGSENMRNRLAQEAWITAQLEHPGIVPVYDAGRSPDGALYYSMRLVRGRSLQEAIEAAPELSERLGLLRHFLDVCEAIAYAHSMGIVHRDLKPHNVMIGEFGETQVVDWGLARPVDADDGHWSTDVLPNEHAAMTLAGDVVGTPHYMSPEQARGLPVTRSSDVWSLGTILYALLSQATLFDGDSDRVLEVLRGNPTLIPVRERMPEVPPELAGIAERALRVQSEERYESAKAVAQDIAAWLDGRRVRAYEYSRWELLRRFWRTWRVPLFVGFLAVMLLVIGGAASYVRIIDEQEKAIVEQEKAIDEQTRAALAEQQSRDSLALAERNQAQADRNLAQADRNLALAERNLASAFVEQSRLLARSGARPEAEVLAAHALALEESPEARGVLATFSATARPQLIETLDEDDLPECTVRVLSSRGEGLLCLEESGLSLWSVHPLKLRWRIAQEVLGGLALDDVDRVLVRLSTQTDALLDAADGTILSEYEREDGQPRGFQHFGRYVAAYLDPPGWGFSIYDGLMGKRQGFVMCAVQDRPVIAITRDGQTRATCCPMRNALYIGPREGFGGNTHVFESMPGGLSHLDFSPDGRLLAGGNARGEVVLMEVESGKVIRRRMALVGAVSDVRFTNDGKQVAISGARGGVQLWQVASGAWVGRLPVRSGRSFRMAREGRGMVTLGETLQRWTLPDVAQPHRFFSEAVQDQVRISSGSVSPGEDVIVAHREDATSFAVFSLQEGERIAHVDLDDGRHNPAVKKGAFSVEGAYYHVVADTIRTPAFDAQTWVASKNWFNLAGQHIDTLQGDLIVQSGDHLFPGQVSWSGMRHWVLIPFPDPIRDIGTDASKKRAILIADSSPQKLLLVTAAEKTGQDPTLDELFEVSKATAVDITLTAGDATRIAVASERDVLIFDASGERYGQLSSPSALLDVAFSPSGRWVAAGAIDGTLRVWSVATGQLLAVLRGHTQRVTWVQFGQDDASLYSSSWDGSLRRWHLSDLETPAKTLVKEMEGAWGLSQAEASGAK